MTTHLGNDGVVNIGASVFGETRDWSIEETAGTVEDSQMGDAAETHKSLKTRWTGSANAWWDEADAGQSALAVGGEVTLTVFPRGDTSGFRQMTGTAIVTGITESGEKDGLVEAAFTFQGSGALTKQATP